MHADSVALYFFPVFSSCPWNRGDTSAMCSVIRTCSWSLFFRPHSVFQDVNRGMGLLTTLLAMECHAEMPPLALFRLSGDGAVTVDFRSFVIYLKISVCPPALHWTVVILSLDWFILILFRCVRYRLVPLVQTMVRSVGQQVCFCTAWPWVKFPFQLQRAQL